MEMCTVCANKNDPLGKVYYLSYFNNFLTKFTDLIYYRVGFSSIFCYNIYYGLKITTI